jgi:hypothetical protein
VRKRSCSVRCPQRTKTKASAWLIPNALRTTHTTTPESRREVSCLIIGGMDAVSPGSWGNQLRVRIDYDTRPLLTGEAAHSLFNLTVKDAGTGTIEVFRNVSVAAGNARCEDKGLEMTRDLGRKTRSDISSAVVPNMAANRRV